MNHFVVPSQLRKVFEFTFIIKTIKMICQQQNIIIICQLFFYNGICSHSHFDNRLCYGEKIYKEKVGKIVTRRVLKNRNEPKKCPHAGSNYGPSVYKTDALPLSYTGF